MQVIVHIDEEAMDKLKQMVDEDNDSQAVLVAVGFTLDNY